MESGGEQKRDGGAGDRRLALDQRRARHAAQRGEDLDTDRLVARFQAGDRQAFAAIYTRYFERLYAYMRLAFRDLHEAEDATQEVFTNLLEALPRYERRGQPFRAWLFTAARNHVLWQLKKQGRIEVVDPAELDRRRESMEPEEGGLPVLDWITDPDLLAFIERLPLPQRQVLFLRYLLGLPNKEAARILEASPNHVSVLHYRALGVLKDRLKAIGRETPEIRPEAMKARFQQAPVLRSRRFMLDP